MVRYLLQLLRGATLRGGLLGCLVAGSALAQSPTLSFVANRGQWPAAVRYRASLPGGTAYLTSTGLVYDWLLAADRQQLHEVVAHDPATGASLPLHHHAVFVDFVGVRATEPAGELRQAAYHNYFVGNDPHRWAGHVPLYSEVRYAGLYPGTSLRYHGTASGELEYDFELAPGASPATIGLRYRGAAGLRLLEDGSLLVQTTVGDVREQRPVAYQPTAAGGRQAVPCRYTLAGTTVGFALPAGYDATRPLIIDPVVAATYTRATADQYAMAATYDAAGNAYSSGYSFGSGYPASPGAYQTTSRGSTEGIIQKFNPQCTSLFYATFLGGNSDDRVIAMRVSAAGELYALTSTFSTNFPATSGSLSTTAGGQGDLALTRFNAAGTAALASTYVGGSGNDTPYTSTTVGNLRSVSIGELVLHPNGDVLVTGSTSSTNFPTTTGAFSQTLRGLQDVFVTCLTGTTLGLRWSTLLGGNNVDYPRDLTLTAAGEPVLVGITASTNFPVTTRAFQANNTDYTGFVARLSATGATLGASALFGPASLSKIALDGAGLPVVAGVAAGSFPGATAGAVQLGLATSTATFVAGLTADFSQLRYVGRLPVIDISAFQTDDCGHLYLAGFNTGTLPVTGGLLAGSSTNGGFQTLTLDAGATRLLFYSPFGTNNGNHTHSGSHRFTRSGTLYQSICDNTRSYAAPATAYSPTNRTIGYDVLTFTINQEVAGGSAPTLVAGITRPDSACAPVRFQFGNSSRNAQRYRWTFGDGSPADTTFAPSHLYTVPGTYRVWLRARRNAVGGCGGNTVDSVSTLVRVLSVPGRVLPATAVLCPNTTLALQAAAGPGYTYRWSTGATTRALTISQPGTYRVVVSNGACSTRDSVLVSAGVVAPTLVAGITRPDSACAPVRFQFGNSSRNAQRYRWTFGDGSPADTTFAPSHLYTVPGTYRVWLRARRNAVGGCGGNTVDSVSAVVRVLSVPGRVLPATAVLCPNTTLALQAAAGPGYSYRWSTGATTRALAVSQPGTYRVVISNGACSTRDSVLVSAVAVPRLPADTTLCTNGSLSLQVRAAPGSTIRWDGGQTTSTLAVNASGTYGVAVTTDGCTFTRQVRVELRRDAQPPNVITPNGDGINDVLELRPLEPGSRLHIYNRWGRLVYSTTDYHNDWGSGQAAGVYYFLLENERYCQPSIKGWVEVVP
jgi:gliding motility-associated-like protein